MAGEHSLQIHIENTYATGDVKRPRGPRSALIKHWNSSPTFVPIPLAQDLQDQAISYWLREHLEPVSQRPADSRDIAGTLTDQVSDWLTKSKCPAVNLAIASLALAIFSQTHHHPQAAKQASKKYSKLLQTAWGTVASLDSSNIDTALMIAFLMGRYEDAIHNPGRSRMLPVVMTAQSFLHHKGAIAIPKFWHDSISPHQLASETMKHSRRGLMWSLLLRRYKLPDWLRCGSMYGERGRELDYDRILVRLLEIRYQLCILKTDLHVVARTADLRTRIEALHQEINDVDMAVQAYEAQFPAHWKFRVFYLMTPGTYPRRHFFSSMVYIYEDYDYALLWNRYFSLRMLIASIGLQSLQLGEPRVDDHRREAQLQCLRQISQMASNLAASIPYCLGRISMIQESDRSADLSPVLLNTDDEIKPHLAGLAAWPLRVAASVEGIDLEHQIWFKSELSNIGRVTGVGVFTYNNINF